MEKIKQFIESDNGKGILTALIVILVGFASFGLGRLSKNNQNSGIEIEYLNQTTSQTTNQEANVISSLEKESKTIFETTTTGKAFFASNRGKKYYSIGCSGGKTIKQENRIYFNTEAEAISAGYSKSTSCK